MKRIISYGLAGLLYTSVSAAQPFDTCPSKAFLFQSQPVQVYGVNLVTGNTTLMQANTGTSSNINAVGFDFDSRYIFGYDTTLKQIVRLGKDFISTPVATSGLPTDHTFFVGDVHNKYFYLYRKSKGLFRLELRPLDSDPNATLVVEQITTQANIALTDFAFHPGNDTLYGVDNNTGALYSFNINDGSATYVGDTGQTGTFGAGYFDVNGYYYLSRNQDGFIFRIDLSSEEKIQSGEVSAVKFADGPSSSQNDGARCAQAPIIDEDSNIDFGDAPDSYSTTLASNGPRHELDGLTWLGSNMPDGEQDGLTGALSDNTTGINDEDGINFVTTLETGLDSLTRVNASVSGYLSLWVDWNQDGDFADSGEQMFTDELLQAGMNSLYMTIPMDALEGQTWLRARFSQQTGLSYDGGSTSGEVEDHQIYVTASDVTVRHFPGESSYATLAFEDNWPHVADYDMNDVVIHYRITEFVKNGVVRKSFIQGRLAAVGADYHNGFAVRLEGLARDAIDTQLSRQYHNQQLTAESGLESDASEAIFIVSEDITSKKTSQCDYFRTHKNCREDESFSFEIHIAILENADSSTLVSMPYDPFIFATPGYYHGEALPLHPGRSWEVHLPDQAPTEKFNGSAMWGLGSDASDPTTHTYFKTSSNLPWALLMFQEWQWPLERTDLVEAYPQFANFAESAGQQGQQWYIPNNARTHLIYQP
ncbi:LruC domain-containing protein [Vibrio nereis]|uniref:LruC domain-containing protein n=1 Tax=Vibrio nereis TaxID=693 RepID=UPI002494638E|nr:LruC domain-containing protein [Vibrio nereis]